MKLKNQPKKSSLKIFLLSFLMFVALTNCQKEETVYGIANEQVNNSISNVENWFKQNRSQHDFKILEHTKTIDWDNAIVSHGEKGEAIEIPLLLDDGIITQFGDDLSFKTFHRLLFLGDDENTFEVFHVQIVTDIAFNNNQETFNFYNFQDDFNGYVAVANIENKVVDFNTYKKGNLIAPKNDTNLKSATYSCTYFVRVYNDGSMEILFLLYCNGTGNDDSGGSSNYHGGGNGGGDSNAETEIKEKIDNVPPSCESFKYESTTSLWQESAVQNIYFNVFLIDINGIKHKYTISFPEPILFGVPKNLVNGGNLSPGTAAEATANALNDVMSEISREYANSHASSTDVKIAFRERLTNSFKDYIPGGRVNFNATNYTVIPTEYKVNTFGIGNCD
ncbi:MAG: hypothetical protein CSA39_03070 [Flavobacteriales bacterium]|nr:MAG: hypothetical protein CSA39_03070 [Flavobacteriales bacterium]